MRNISTGIQKRRWYFT